MIFPNNPIFQKNMEIRHNGLTIKTNAADMQAGYMQICYLYAGADPNTNAFQPIPAPVIKEIHNMCDLVYDIMSGEISGFWNCLQLTAKNTFRKDASFIATIDAKCTEQVADYTYVQQHASVLLQSEKEVLDSFQFDPVESDKTNVTNSYMCIYNNFGKSIDPMVRYLRFNTDHGLYVNHKPMFDTPSSRVPHLHIYKNAEQVAGTVYSTNTGTRHLFLGLTYRISNGMCPPQVPAVYNPAMNRYRDARISLEHAYVRMSKKLTAKLQALPQPLDLTSLYDICQKDSSFTEILQPKSLANTEETLFTLSESDVFESLLTPSNPAIRGYSNIFISEKPKYYFNLVGDYVVFALQIPWDKHGRYTLLPKKFMTACSKLHKDKRQKARLEVSNFIKYPGITSTANEDKNTAIQTIMSALTQEGYVATYNPQLPFDIQYIEADLH